MQMTLKPKVLTAEGFAPYGQVLMSTGETVHRCEFAARLENRRANARPNMTFIKAKPVDTRVIVRIMERHSHSSQAFVPLNGTRYLLTVCPATADGKPDIARVEVFIAEAHQAINFNLGVWHGPNTVLREPGEFIMLRWDDGSAADTNIWTLSPPLEIAFA